MRGLIQSVLDSHEKIELQQFVKILSASQKRYLLRNEILHEFTEYCVQSQKPAYFYHSSLLGELIHYTHEILLEEEGIWFVVRARLASQEVWQLAPDCSEAALMPPQALLQARDRQVNRARPHILELNFRPFSQDTPSINDARNIGQGLTFLNRHLCDRLLSDPDYWQETLFDVLHRHEFNGIPLLIGDRIESASQLHQQVVKAIELVDKLPPETPYSQLHLELQALGFEPGWGNTAARVYETLELLDRLLVNPDPPLLETFVARIPAMFRVVIVAVHGWVSQQKVLGRAETMGQIVYAIAQARSLANQLQQDIERTGLTELGIQPQVVLLARLIPNCEGTLCDRPLEKIEGTENAWIVRVPFREFNPKVTQNWISKFEIWPYLETFAADAEPVLLDLMQGAPHLCIGHYSDGGIVAFLLARRFNAIQCHIAHSLEKSKYLFSDLYWHECEDNYHFSLQFTADLINMNAADFIIASLYQEIIGTPDTIGQYESYKCFTLPQLYHVIDGIDLFSSRFNVVPPGIDPHWFFPYYQTGDRDPQTGDRLKHLLFDAEADNTLGRLDDPDKRPLLAVGSMNQTNNFAGLVECFGQSPQLRERCNLILVTNKFHADDSSNPEEIGEIENINTLIERHQLHSQIRWIGHRFSIIDMGEIYRIIADRQGILINFARFEAFGRSLLEAMRSGLPTFATEFGGASEIIQDGDNGFLINPTDLDRTVAKLVEFLDRCQSDPQTWSDLSDRAIQRIETYYNWQTHAKQVLVFAKIYGFWKYISRNRREALQSYLDALFHLLYKPRADRILQQHLNR